jgi:hypothetical protein
LFTQATYPRGDHSEIHHSLLHKFNAPTIGLSWPEMTRFLAALSPGNPPTSGGDHFFLRRNFLALFLLNGGLNCTLRRRTNAAQTGVFHACANVHPVCLKLAFEVAAVMLACELFSPITLNGTVRVQTVLANPRPTTLGID